MNNLFRSVLITLALMGSAHATPIVYVATLNGANESPSNPSLGTGNARAELDLVAHTLQLDVSFQGLTGLTSAAHIHSATPTAGTGTASVATTNPTFLNFPSNVSSGTYSILLDTLASSTFSGAYIVANGNTVAGAEAALALGLAQGKAYFNIHTSAFSGGEIRGFFAVPEAEQTALVLIGLSGLLFRKRVKTA